MKIELIKYCSYALSNYLLIYVSGPNSSRIHSHLTFEPCSLPFVCNGNYIQLLIARLYAADYITMSRRLKQRAWQQQKAQMYAIKKHSLNVNKRLYLVASAKPLQFSCTYNIYKRYLYTNANAGIHVRNVVHTHAYLRLRMWLCTKLFEGAHKGERREHCTWCSLNLDKMACTHTNVEDGERLKVHAHLP